MKFSSLVDLLLIQLLVVIAYSNLQARLHFFEYCTYYGYPVQKHIIRTQDNYTLQYYRIQKKNTTIKPLQKVLYLQHGLLDSADTWLVNDEDKAPGFILANKGYDVWLGNSRGNRYSSPQINTKVRDFWNFTFDEMANYDIPAAFSYISKVTSKKIHYIGHSQGTMTMFIALSANNPIVQANIASFSALGPVAYLTNMKSTLLRSLGKKALYKLLKGLQVKQVMLLPQDTSNLLSLMCKIDNLACKITLIEISEMNNTVNNVKRLPVIMGHFPAGTSLKNVEHFNQFINKASFCKFDYGQKQNMIIYGTKDPPKYDLSKIRIPIHLFVGKYDKLADVEDAQKLFNELTNSPDKKFMTYNYGHATFIWGKQPTYIDDVINIIQSAIIEQE